MSLYDRASRAFDDAIVLAGEGAPDRLVETLAGARAGLAAPMRVAVVGRIKAGKSTMMNALLGRAVAPTGQEELTFNVNWFVHADPPRVTVHFVDGRPPERRALSELGQVVTRTSGQPDLLTSIAHVEVGLPLEMLNRLQLIDTPGFGSFFETDSRNTLEFLGVDPDHVDGATRSHAASADAVLHLFSRSLGAAEHAIVDDFQGAAIGDFTPVNAIGILTKTDTYWTPDAADTDPLQIGGGIARRILGEHGVDRVLYDVLPVCGLLAAGAATLNHTDLAVLDDLAVYPPEVLLRRLRYAARFASAHYDDLPVAPQRRAAILGLLGQHGIWLACSLVRDGMTEIEELRAELLDRSGLARVRDLLLSHFGNRAAVIKSANAVNRCRALSARLAQELIGPSAGLAAAVAGRLEQFEITEHGVAELALLRALYRNDDRLGLSANEIAELLAVTGERGPTAAARLRAELRSTPDELLGLVAERLRYWQRRAMEFGLDGRTVHAARTIRRSYEQIGYHVREAKQHLEMTA